MGIIPYGMNFVKREIDIIHIELNIFSVWATSKRNCPDVVGLLQSLLTLSLRAAALGDAILMAKQSPSAVCQRRA